MLTQLLRSRDRMPVARLDHQSLETFFGLDASELIASVFLGIIMPLVMMGSHLPGLLWLVGVAAFPLWALFLFFVGYGDPRHSARYWIGIVVPFWLRQRRFYRRELVRERGRSRARDERLDAALELETNHLWFRWQDGEDGVPELHVFEEPAAPYRGWIRRAGTPAPAPDLEDL